MSNSCYLNIRPGDRIQFLSTNALYLVHEQKVIDNRIITIIVGNHVNDYNHLDFQRNSSFESLQYYHKKFNSEWIAKMSWYLNHYCPYSVVKNIKKIEPQKASTSKKMSPYCITDLNLEKFKTGGFPKSEEAVRNRWKFDYQ